MNYVHKKATKDVKKEVRKKFMGTYFSLEINVGLLLFFSMKKSLKHGVVGIFGEGMG